MPSQEDVNASAVKGLESARIRYMTLSLILIVFHAGGFQLSNEIHLFGLKLAEASRPGVLYDLLWVALAWLTFVYWQHYRKSPDRSAERLRVTEAVKHGGLRDWQLANPQWEGQRYEDIKISPDLRSVRISIHRDPDDRASAEEYDVPADVVKRARRGARKGLILYEPETIALRLPFVLAALAVLVALVDRIVL